MALFWFICGILLICGIARYNESNKLFWTLLVSFVGTFAAASIVIATCNNNTKNVETNDTTYDVPTSTSVTVSKDYYVSNDVLSDSRVSNLEDKPPQSKQLCYNISIPPKLSKFNPIKDSS